MKRTIFILVFFVLIRTIYVFGKEESINTISSETRKLLESKGFQVFGPAQSLAFSRKDSIENTKNIARIKIGFNLNQSSFGLFKTHMSHQTSPDTILYEDFESNFPRTTWQRSGDPTWGKTNYEKRSGKYSCWCAKDSTLGREPQTGYPNNCRSKIIFGPFDLSNVNFSQLKFSYWLDSEYEKDWLFCMVSIDGSNFYGIGLSGKSNYFIGEIHWDEETLLLTDVQTLGDVTGQSQVWLTFIFESDDHSTTNIGAFIDNILITKRFFNGTIIAGYISEPLIAENNPYIAVANIGVPQNKKLVINPGVAIRFEPKTEFIVFGSLYAVGTLADSIYFTSNSENPSPGDWSGIAFDNTPFDTSQIRYCCVKYGGHEDFGIDADNVDISNCRIQYNKNARILTEDRVNIEENTIVFNDIGIRSSNSSSIKVVNNIIEQNGTGIRSAYTYGSSLFVYNNKIANNRECGILGAATDLIAVDNIIKNNGLHGIQNGGAYLWIPTDLTAVHNKIIGNGGSGIIIDAYAANANINENIIVDNALNGFHSSVSFINPKVLMFNNTIVRNKECGINFEGGTLSYSYFINNIVVDNDSCGLLKIGSCESANIDHNDFFGNHPDFMVDLNQLGKQDSLNSNGDKCDIYYNITADPLFINQAQDDFHLAENSPCKNAGNPCAIYNNMDGTCNDIGAFGGNSLCIAPTFYNFGETLVGSKKDVYISFINNRDVEVCIDSIVFNDINNFSHNYFSENIKIPPFKKEDIIIYFQPQSAGDFVTDLIFYSNNFYGTNRAMVLFKGKGIIGTLIDSDDVSGKWIKSKSPYLVKECYVQGGKTLTIEPGVHVYIEENVDILVDGSFIAVGTEQDSIVFTAYSPKGRWDGICLYDRYPKSRIEYCRIENTAGYAIGAYGNASLIIKNNLIQNGGGAIDCDYNSSPHQIVNNTIRNHNVTYGMGGALMIEGGSALIEKNKIYNNKCIAHGGGIHIGGPAKVFNNLIFNNHADEGGGIGFWYPGEQSYIENNIIVFNTAHSQGGGISFAGYVIANLTNNVIAFNSTDYFGGGITAEDLSASSSVFNNNSIIYFNTAKIDSQISDDYHDIKISYSNIQDGWEGAGNIDSNPLFVNPDSINFYLQPSSACIDKGNPNSRYNDPEDPTNPGYALKPSMGTVRNDMGAYGGPRTANWIITAVEFKPEKMPNLPKSFELCQNYPNPFNSTTIIKYYLPQNTEVSLKIYNILGQLIRTFVDEKQIEGNYSINWDGKDNSGQLVASGIYMYELRTQNFIKMKKMVMIR